MIFKSLEAKVVELVRKGKEIEAINLMSKYEEKRKNDVKFLYELARLYFKIGEFHKCKSYLLRAVELNINENHIKEILEMTNWFMLSSFNYFNNWFSFSPDGNKIVFSSARRDTNNDGKINVYDKPGIYIINTYGTNEQYIVSDEYYNFSPLFLPDGERILYLSARKDTNRDGFIDYRDNAALYIADLKKGVEELLISDEHKVKNITLSPDGSKILFSCWFKDSKASGIYTLDLKTKSIDTLLPAGTLYEHTFPSYSPDGKKIVYASWRHDTDGDGAITLRDNSAIYLLDTDLKFETALTGYAYNNMFPIFHPDGKKIIYLSIRRDTNGDGFIDNLDNANICMFDLKTKREKVLIPDNQYIRFLSLTKDGDAFVFVSSWPGGKSEHMDRYENKGIYLYEFKSKKIKQIVNEKYYGCRSPLVSIKREVGYLSWRKGVNRGLFLAYIDKLPTREQLKSIIEKNL